MKLDLTNFPVIDAHCHRFCTMREPKEFGYVAGGVYEGPGQNEFRKETLLYKMLIERMRKFFGMPETAAEEEVVAERYRRYGENPQAYFAAMIEDAKVEAFCAELGSPIEKLEYQPDEIAFYNSCIPKHKRANIVRTERLMEKLFQEELPFSSFISEFHTRLDQQIRDEHAVGIKTCIAYYGGLRVEIVDEHSAKTAYDNYRKDRQNRTAKKRIYDYMVAMGLDACIRTTCPCRCIPEQALAIC